MPDTVHHTLYVVLVSDSSPGRFNEVRELRVMEVKWLVQIQRARK